MNSNNRAHKRLKTSVFQVPNRMFPIQIIQFNVQCSKVNEFNVQTSMFQVHIIKFKGKRVQIIKFNVQSSKFKGKKFLVKKILVK